ncbi:MAG: hypothetical protein E6860_09435 [Clostridium sp.]|nr:MULTISPECIES: hypothetical protein [Clostridium]MDU1585748.1 hypothetical protein [Clostridium sp.]MDU1992504.1 hypothetical protein [Clostridium sp.]
MSEVPNKLKCAYCKRNRMHGGECTSQKSPCDKSGCLIFLEDERGCIRNGDLKIPIKLYEDIPVLMQWDDRWTIYDNDTSIRIREIRGITWGVKEGYLYIHANCDYYVNEYKEGYKENKSKPKLTLVK